MLQGAVLRHSPRAYSAALFYVRQGLFLRLGTFLGARNTMFFYKRDAEGLAAARSRLLFLQRVALLFITLASLRYVVPRQRNLVLSLGVLDLSGVQAATSPIRRGFW